MTDRNFYEKGDGYFGGNLDVGGTFTPAGALNIGGAVTESQPIVGSSGTVIVHSIAPTSTQTGTAAFTALDINVTETTTGSGAKNLINARVGGSSKFSVSDGGKVQAAAGIAAFGHAVPASAASITGALSTVADAPAKAVLTSIIAALVGCGMATDGTT